MTEEEEKHLLVFELFNSDRVLWLRHTKHHYNIPANDVRYNEITDTSNFLDEKDFLEFLTVPPDNGIKLNSAGERYFENLIKKKATEKLQSYLLESTIATNRLQRITIRWSLFIASLTFIAILMQVYLASKQVGISDEQSRQSKIIELKLLTIDTLKIRLQLMQQSLDSLRVLRDTSIVSKKPKN